MFKKTIKYTDYNGVERNEAFYFNLSPADLLDMEVESGGYKQMLQNIIESQDVVSLMKAFKDIIRRSYGVKSSDGKHFVKTYENFLAFQSTPAYSEMIMEFINDTDKAIEFVNGVMPTNVTAPALSVVSAEA